MKCENTDCQNKTFGAEKLCINCMAATLGSSAWTPPAGSIQSATANASLPTERLMNVRNALQVLATGEAADAYAIKQVLPALVKQLDDVLQALAQERQTGEQERRQLQWQAENARCDADLERERRRIEPIKPNALPGPHRIDWKHGTGLNVTVCGGIR